MSDLFDAVTIALSAFFIVLAVLLLLRYRQASERISESSDLGHDLWKALEERMKKQDERILDLLGRVEVLQARVLSSSSAPSFSPSRITRPSHDVIASQLEPRFESRPAMDSAEPSESGSTTAETRMTVSAKSDLTDTEVMVVRLLGEGAKSTTEIKKAVKGGKLTREHTARVMRALFDRGLVTRDDSEKPFVYQLTEKGRGFLSGS